MRTDMLNLEFEGQGVRMHVENDEPWFVLSDVCRVLEIGNPSQAATRLDDDEKGIISSDTLRGRQDAIIINESGLYSLILTSRKPAAKRFKKWVTAEVLPTLRRTGIYMMSERDEDLPALADGKVFGMRIAKVNAAARLIATANAIYGPEAARALWESEAGLPKIAHKALAAIAGTAQDDPEGCFRHLMRMATGNGRSVGQVLSLAMHDKVAARALPAFGLVADPAGRKGFLAVAGDHPFLVQAYAETQWAGAWNEALLSLPGARMGRARVDKSPSLCVFLPRQTVQRLLPLMH